MSFIFYFNNYGRSSRKRKLCTNASLRVFNERYGYNRVQSRLRAFCEVLSLR